MRHALALIAAALLAAVLPAGLLVAQGPRAASLGGGSLGGGSGGAVGGAAAVRIGNGTADSVGVRWRASRARPPDPASGFRIIPLAGGRRYAMHLPPPQLARFRAPVMIVLHGLHNSWQRVERDGGWARYADRHGFLVSYGIGVDRSWNAGSCCGAAQRRGIDDVGYLVALVADLAARYPIDRTRVYVTGFSAGDMMAVRAECDRPDVFAAAGGSSGALVSPCRAPAGLIRVRHLHGRLDTVVPYRGGYSGYTGTWFPAAAALPRLVAAGSPRPVVSVRTLDCAHAWPLRGNACRVDGTDLIWRWVSRFRRPPGAVPARSPQL